MANLETKIAFEYTTALGSTYTQYIDGSSERVKAPRDGHIESGKRGRHDWTVFLEENDALIVAEHIHKPNTTIVFADRMVICGEFIEGTGWVAKHKFLYFRIPRIGLCPFQVSNLVKEPVGHRVRGKAHVGNFVVSIDN